MKVVRKITKRLQDIQKAAISAEMSLPTPPSTSAPVKNTDEGAEEPDMTEKSSRVKNTERAGDKDETLEQRAFREKQREMIAALDLSK